MNHKELARQSRNRTQIPGVNGHKKHKVRKIETTARGLGGWKSSYDPIFLPKIRRYGAGGGKLDRRNILFKPIDERCTQQTTVCRNG